MDCRDPNEYYNDIELVLAEENGLKLIEQGGNQYKNTSIIISENIIHGDRPANKSEDNVNDTEDIHTGDGGIYFDGVLSEIEDFETRIPYLSAAHTLSTSQTCQIRWPSRAKIVSHAGVEHLEYGNPSAKKVLLSHVNNKVNFSTP